MPSLRRPRSVSSLSSTSSSLSLASSNVNTTTNVFHPSQDELMLLNMMPSKFHTQVKISRNSFMSYRRTIEIRANIMILLKSKSKQSTDTIDYKDITFAVQIPSLQCISKASNTSIKFSTLLLNHQVTFPSSNKLSQFLSIVNSSNDSSSSLIPEISGSKLSSLPLLGKGATSEVRLLSDTKVIKCIEKSDLFDKEDSLTQLIYEKLTLTKVSRTNDSNVIKLYKSFQTNTHFCFVTELAEYGDLHSIISKLPSSTTLPIHIIKQLFKQITHALHTLHKSGTVYRDMKLGNILLNKNGYIKLADFGLCKPLNTKDVDEENFRIVGRTSSFVGTRRYMSPELISIDHKKRSYNTSVDMWALGITLYVMVCGKYPHFSHIDPSQENIDYTSLFLSICNDDVNIPTDLDDDLQHLLKGLLNRDALERFDLNDVMKHPWIANIPLQNEKERGINHELIDFLNENNIRTLTEKYVDDNKKIITSQLESSLVTSSDEDSSPSNPEQLDAAAAAAVDHTHLISNNLLGFEYMGQI